MTLNTGGTTVILECRMQLNPRAKWKNVPGDLHLDHLLQAGMYCLVVLFLENRSGRPMQPKSGVQERCNGSILGLKPSKDALLRVSTSNPPSPDWQTALRPLK